MLICVVALIIKKCRKWFIKGQAAQFSRYLENPGLTKTEQPGQEARAVPFHCFRVLLPASLA